MRKEKLKEKETKEKDKKVDDKENDNEEIDEDDEAKQKGATTDEIPCECCRLLFHPSHGKTLYHRGSEETYFLCRSCNSAQNG